MLQPVVSNSQQWVLTYLNTFWETSGTLDEKPNLIKEVNEMRTDMIIPETSDWKSTTMKLSPSVDTEYNATSPCRKNNYQVSGTKQVGLC